MEKIDKVRVIVASGTSGRKGLPSPDDPNVQIQMGDTFFANDQELDEVYKNSKSAMWENRRRLEEQMADLDTLMLSVFYMENKP